MNSSRLLFQGCYEKVEEWLDDNKHLLGTIAMCVLVIQVSSSGGASSLPVGPFNARRVFTTSCVESRRLFSPDGGDAVRPQVSDSRGRPPQSSMVLCWTSTASLVLPSAFHTDYLNTFSGL